MLAHSEVQIASGVVERLEIACAFKREVHFVRFGQIGRAADEPRNILRERVQHLAATFARGNAFGVRGEGWQVLVPAAGQFTMLHLVESLRQVGILLGVFREVFIPLRSQVASTLADAILEVLVDAFGNQELGIFGPAVKLLGQADFLLAQRFSMRFVGILLVRRAVSDVAIDDDERGPVFGDDKGAVGAAESVEIVGIADVRDVPAIAQEA